MLRMARAVAMQRGLRVNRARSANFNIKRDIPGNQLIRDGAKIAAVRRGPYR